MGEHGPDGMIGGFTMPVAITRGLWRVIDIEPRDSAGEPRWHQLARPRANQPEAASTTCSGWQPLRLGVRLTETARSTRSSRC